MSANRGRIRVISMNVLAWQRLNARLILISVVVFAAGCASSPPRQPDDLCKIFEEKRDWYKAAKSASKRWGAPIPVPMAIMYQESSFQAKARPPRRYFLGFIPFGRVSSAYGYSQAKTPSWEDYQRESGNHWADRDNFADAMDFLQWYISKSHRVNGVSKADAYRQYLNYHEGWTGYRRGNYRQKQWLLATARKVDARAKRYAGQYKRCKKDLNRGWLWRLLFAESDPPHAQADLIEEETG